LPEPVFTCSNFQCPLVFFLHYWVGIQKLELIVSVCLFVYIIQLADSVKRGKRMKCGMITIPKGGKKKLNRSLRESPEICPHRGGTIGCEGRYCRFTFHYACAKAKGCYMHESKHPKTNAVQYKLYCPNHIPSNVSTPCAAPSAQPPLSATPDHPPANEQAPPVLPAAQCAQPDQPCQSAETTRCNTGEEAEDHGVCNTRSHAEFKLFRPSVLGCVCV